MRRFARLSDEAVDRLLDGLITDPELDDVVPFIEQLRERGTRRVAEETLALHVWGATSAAGNAGKDADGSHLPSSLTPGNGTDRSKRRRRVAVRGRWAVAVSSILILTGSTTGVAWAANGAKPGDLLYGIDRALEAIGINDGGGAERIAEIRALFDSGEIAPGLTQAAEVVPEMSGGASPEDQAQASAALEAAAETVESRGGETSEPTRQAVADLLRYLSDNVGHVDTSEVVGFAHSIGAAERGKGTAPEDPSTDAPGEAEKVPGPPAEAPGQSDKTPGPPADSPGRSENTPGPPENTPGPPENTPGPPADTPGKGRQP